MAGLSDNSGGINFGTGLLWALNQLSTGAGLIITTLIKGKFLQEDGTSRILLEDGVSFLIYEG